MTLSSLQKHNCHMLIFLEQLRSWRIINGNITRNIKKMKMGPNGLEPATSRLTDTNDGA